jgi:glycosyltransferase involved in cell wall biosynthesis
MLIDALGMLLAKGISFTSSVYGSPLLEDESYYESLKVRAESAGLHDRIRFYPGIPHSATPAIYAAHDIFVNCSPSGMFDKTLFEAAAAGCRVIAASEDFRDAAGDMAYAPTVNILAERLQEVLEADDDELVRSRLHMHALSKEESLATLADRLVIAMNIAYS